MNGNRVNTADASCDPSPGGLQGGKPAGRLGGFVKSHHLVSIHAMNNRLLRELLSRPDAYEVVTFDKAAEAPRGFAALQPETV